MENQATIFTIIYLQLHILLERVNPRLTSLLRIAHIHYHFGIFSVVLLAVGMLPLQASAANEEQNIPVVEGLSSVSTEYLNQNTEGVVQLNSYEQKRLISYIQTGENPAPSLEEKYSVLAGEHFYPNVYPYLADIDAVLIEKGLDTDTELVKIMFYVGQRESGWGQYRVSSFNIGGENPTGIFQFLPSTFRSVSSGNIFNVQDQVRAFVTMMERGRVDEYHVMFVCSYAPCLTYAQKEYAFNYSFNASITAGQSVEHNSEPVDVKDQLAEEAGENIKNNSEVAIYGLPVEGLVDF